ncbi:MAG: aldehyde ferredoxin oxidoreductase C-terminal domain-containing protein, partial [Candidatus Bipolaricaulota bacterium]
GGIGFEAYSRILVGPATCVGCPAWCKNVVKTQFDGKEVRGPGPEYETLAALGSLCLNNDLDAVALANQKCNLYGLDTISTGVTIAFAMEAAERGLLRGYNIKWGDAQRILSLIDEIATRQGVGDALADGVARLSAEMGVDFAQEVKGQEIALHEPRGKKGFALSVATSPQGGHHTQGMHDHSFQTTPVAEELGISGCVDPLSFDKQAEVVKTYEDLMSFTDSCILCRFTSFNRTGRRYLYPQVREALYAVTGIEMSAREMLATGERNYLLLRLAANAAGYGREHDRLPRRMHTPLPSGPLAGTAIGEEELSLAIDAYYSARGYDPLGRPMSDKLRELGIDVTGYRKL